MPVLILLVIIIKKNKKTQFFQSSIGFTNPAFLPAQQQLEALSWKSVHLSAAAFVKALPQELLKGNFPSQDGVHGGLDLGQDFNPKFKNYTSDSHRSVFCPKICSPD